jgi:SAM-dependent methyltransferase
MPRIFILFIIILFILGCKRSDNRESESEIQDSDSINITIDSSIQLEDFDDLVKKYEDPERLSWQNPDKVLDKMGDLNNLTVADIGVGTGYFAFRIVRRGAKLIGIDIEEKFLEYIEDRKSDLPESFSERITTRLTAPDTPSLLNNEVDWVLIVNTYYILNNRVNYLQKIRDGLKTGGRLIVVDFKSGNIPIGPNEDEKVASEEAIMEMKDAGFKIIDKDLNSLQYQYIIVAQK